MPAALFHLRGMSPLARSKATLLGGWFFLMITTLWLLKPIRQASLLAHLGPTELPYARLGSIVVVGILVAIYSWIVDRLTRLQVMRGANLVFAVALGALWIALETGGEALGGQRWFVWTVFILVDVYSTVMVGIFWTYTNDVVSREEADELYGPIGLGGILGGIAGGLIVDALVDWIGHVAMLPICIALTIGSMVLVTRSEATFHPRPRPRRPRHRTRLPAALEGASLVAHSRYLAWIVLVVVGYELAAAMTDFVVSVVFARSFPDQAEMTKMFGRLGWAVSGGALVSQLVLVPRLLPHKRVALLVPPIVMALATLGLTLLPVIGLAFALSMSDRGLNYSLQQSTKETLYVPLSDGEKYKAKAFIDMFADRAGKAASSIALILIIALAGVSIPLMSLIVFGALAVWMFGAARLGVAYGTVAERREPPT